MPFRQDDLLFVIEFALVPREEVLRALPTSLS